MMTEAEYLLVRRARQLLPRAAWALMLVNIIVMASVAAYAVMQGEALWQQFRSEYSLATWFSSVQLLLLSVLCYMIYRTLALVRQLGANRVTYAWAWAVGSAGFLFLALDERFNIHELLRDEMFQPLGVFADSPYFIAGDAGLYVFFLLGLGLTPFLFAELRKARYAVTLFLIAALLSFATIVIDSLQYKAMQNWIARRFWDYTFEELGEIWAELLFLFAFLSVLARRLDTLICDGLNDASAAHVEEPAGQFGGVRESGVERR